MGNIENLMPDILTKLGVQIEEKFDLFYGCNKRVVPLSPYHFNENFSLLDANGHYSSYILADLIKGECIIVKRPFKPKYKEQYWYWSFESNGAFISAFEKTNFDFAMWKIGNCFRTEEEAKTIGKELIEEIMGEYNNG